MLDSFHWGYVFLFVLLISFYQHLAPKKEVLYVVLQQLNKSSLITVDAWHNEGDACLLVLSVLDHAEHLVFVKALYPLSENYELVKFVSGLKLCKESAVNAFLYLL